MSIENDIAEKMADLENSWQPFKDIDTIYGSAFHAQDYLEESVENSGGYPIAFRSPPEFWQADKATGVRGAGAPAGKQPSQIQFRRYGLAIMVGLYSNKIKALTAQAALYIDPLHALYLRNYTLDGLVENLWLETGKMGRWEFHEAQHYGLVVPIVVKFKTRYQVG